MHRLLWRLNNIIVLSEFCAAKSAPPSKLGTAGRPTSGPTKPAGGLQRGNAGLGTGKPAQQATRLPAGGAATGASAALAQKDVQIQEMDKQVGWEITKASHLITKEYVGLCLNLWNRVCNFPQFCTLLRHCALGGVFSCGRVFCSTQRGWSED